MRKILFIGEDYKRGRNFFKSILKYFYRFNGQLGFFLASLYQYNKVVEKDWYFLKNQDSTTINEKYDIIVIACRYLKSTERNFDELQSILKSIEITKIYFAHNAVAGYIPGNDQLFDSFDLIFKREPLKDINKYNISESNKKKLRITALPCRLLNVNILNVKSYKVKPLSLSKKHSFKHDVFFAGALSNQMRLDIVKFFKMSQKYKFYGGLQGKIDEQYKQYQFPMLKQKEFIKAIQGSKINLALNGIGEFTYRHLELFYLGVFVITTSDIRNQLLPFGFKEGRDFVVFENLNDLEKKVDYYLYHEAQRLKIAASGQQVFLRDYDFKKHGEYILSQIKKVEHGR